VPNTLIFRNMLPSTESFDESIQGALTVGCVFNNTPPLPPDAIPTAGECASDFMKEYYPKGVICDKAVFVAQGWQGCFAAEP
jgi:hypothetical protein